MFANLLKLLGELAKVLYLLLSNYCKTQESGTAKWKGAQGKVGVGPVGVSMHGTLPAHWCVCQSDLSEAQGLGVKLGFLM